MVTLRTFVGLLSVALICGCTVLLSGCTISIGKNEEPKAEKVEKVEKKDGIIHKTTQDVGKFDPNAKHLVVSDQQAHATDPITGPLAVYGPAVENIAKMKIKMELETYNAAEGHYPKDYEEFMEKIIKGRDIHLPMLPYKGQYQYDEATRELVIVRDEENAKKSGQEVPAAEGEASEKAN